MLWGIDAATPPTNPRALVADGWAFAMGYVGGRAAHVWSAADFAECAAAGLSVGAVWVAPTTDTGYDAGVLAGNELLAAMQAHGLTSWVWLDVEDGAVMPKYAAGLVSSVHAGQCQVGIYGSRATIEGMGNLFDTWWLASWVTPGAVLVPAPPDFTIWQFATGPQFDYNVAVDNCPFTGIGPS